MAIMLIRLLWVKLLAEAKKLLAVTKQSLYEGIQVILKLGNRVGDVGFAIQNYAEDHGYGVVRELGWPWT